MQFELLVDEISKVSKQNNQYRGLILGNEEQLSQIQKEIFDLQKRIELKNQLVNRANEEKTIFQKQYEKLIEEMKANSDSESAEEIDMKAQVIEQRQRIKILENNLKNKDADQKLKVQEVTTNLDRLQANL